MKAAQAKVVGMEMKFVEAQELRRETHTMIADIQKRIKDLHVELEKTNRGEDRYGLDSRLGWSRKHCFGIFSGT